MRNTNLSIEIIPLILINICEINVHARKIWYHTINVSSCKVQIMHSAESIEFMGASFRGLLTFYKFVGT